MSDCRRKGLHYTVKRVIRRETHGVECLLCGAAGDLEEQTRPFPGDPDCARRSNF